MAQTRGLITGITKEGLAEVAIDRKSACGGCKSTQDCHGCLSNSNKLTTMVKNPVGAKTGDVVSLQVSDRELYKGAIALYLLPILLLIVAAGIGTALGTRLGIGETAAALTLGAIGLGLGLGLAAYISRRFKKSGRLTPRINAVIYSGRSTVKA